MSTKKSPTDDWKPCPKGTLRVFAGRERTRQHRKFLTRVAGASAVVMLAISVGYMAWGPLQSGEHTYGGVTCTTVRANAPQFIGGVLEPQLSEQIRIHLEKCPNCQRMWQEMSKSMKQASAATRHHDTGICECPTCRRQLMAALEIGQ